MCVLVTECFVIGVNVCSCNIVRFDVYVACVCVCVCVCERERERVTYLIE